jgi:hypothetical protein
MDNSSVRDLYKPFTAGPFDRIVGFDERGEPVYRTVIGHTYSTGPTPLDLEQEPPRTRIENRADAQGRHSHYRVPDPLPKSAQAIRSFAEALAAGFTAPGRAARGEPVTLGDALGTSVSPGALAAPARAPRGALRMFAGRNARTANLDALARAEALSSQGLEAGEIYRDMGCFKAADGQWRFEIDDSGARVTPLSSEERALIDTEPGKRFPVGSLFEWLDHKELYEAYPGIEHTTVTA